MTATNPPPYPGKVRDPETYQLQAQDANVRWLFGELGKGALSRYFRRGDQLVDCNRIGEDGYRAPTNARDENGPSTLRTVKAVHVLGTLAVDYRVERFVASSNQWVGAIFPTQAAQLVVEQLDRAPNLRVLRGVTHTPVVRADGSILSAPGYDPVSGFLHVPTVAVPDVPVAPSGEQLAAAVALLREMVAEFVWAGKHDEANFLGVLLTPLLRLVCPPPYKLVGIMAHQPGSGKSLLGRILREIHGGVFRTEMPHDDAEMGKSLTSILTQTTAPIVQFDNVSGTLRSSRLAGLLTSAVYTDRILGSTTDVEMVNDRLWLVTGNNLQLGGDLARRALWVTIDPKVPNPELRTGFRLDLTGGWALRHRGEILHALLTLVAAWQAAGRPVPAERSSDDYAVWRSVVAGILTHAGIPGEFDAIESAQQAVGVDDEGWGAFLEALHGQFGEGVFTTRDVVLRLMPTMEGPSPLADTLPDALAEKFEAGKSVARSLGKWFQNRNGRFVGPYVCERLSVMSADNTAQFRVRCVDAGGYGES